MTDDKKKQLFLSLIYSFQMQTMMQLGKLVNPVTGTIEKELDGAQVTIDMLDMLKEKTKGNSSEEEIRFLDQVIADLHLQKIFYLYRQILPAFLQPEKADEKIADSETSEKTDDAKEEKPDGEK